MTTSNRVGANNLDCWSDNILTRKLTVIIITASVNIFPISKFVPVKKIPKTEIDSSKSSNEVENRNGEAINYKYAFCVRQIFHTLKSIIEYNHLLIGAWRVYNKRKMRIISAPPREKVGLFQNLRFDLSVFFIGSTSSESGKSERLGFQLTYLSAEKFENRVFFPCFLNFDHALSQSVEDLSPKTHFTKS